MQPAGPTQGAGPDKVRQTRLGPVTSAPSPTGVSFDGVGVGLANFAPSSNPPDVNGRVGATQYVQWNNTSFAVFNKANGALLYGPAAGNTLFQPLGGVCASHNDGDPVVSFDILAGRWVLSQFVVNGPAGSASHQCVAVSVTGDATGEYYLYDFLTDGTNFVDYPHTGVWPDGYYMSAHVFNAAGTSLVAARVYVFEREKMIAGQPARMLSANLDATGGTQYGFLPADLDSLTPPPAGEASFILGPHPSNLALTSSTRVAVTWGTTPTITLTSATIPTAAYTTAYCISTGRACVKQPTPAANADSLDNIKSHFMYRLAYRNNGSQATPQESLMANIPVRGATTNTTHDAIRWYEFRNDGTSTATPTIFQQSTFDPDATYRWLGSIAMDKDQNIAMGYSSSSSTLFPSIYLTGRLSSDAVNTMGGEVQMQAGAGSQTSGGGNRWGDYSSITLDPVDQCTFYYTNEYLKASGTFNWSTRIAAFRFPTCTDAPAWGTVTGTVTSSETGAPVSGVVVTLSNGYAGATNAAGVYSFIVPPGNYTASAADANRNCSMAMPSSAPVSVTSSGSVTQNFTIGGASKLEANGFSISDSAAGNNNGVLNKNECVTFSANLKNNGCATESAISATLTTTTPGVTIVDGSSSYPDLLIDASSNNNTPFRISTASDFVCGTQVDLALNLTYAGGTKTVHYFVPTCAGGPDQSIPADQLTTTSPTQNDRVGRTGIPSTCAGKASPGGGFTGTHYYKTYTFTNNSGASACYTVTINAATGGPGDIESVAYLNTYDPANIGTNYLGDTGIVGLGTTVGSASYSFTVPALQNFVVVVETSGATASSVYSGTVSGFPDQNPGPGGCPAAPTPPTLVSAVSRLTNPAGTFDIDLPLSSTLGIEDRINSGNYSIVFTFDQPVQSGSAQVSGTGNAGAPTFNGNQMTVPLSGVADQQTLTVTVSNIMGSNGGTLASASVNVGFLIGDTTGNGTVNSSDVSDTKNQSGANDNATNFRNDVNNSGQVNGTDVTQVKEASGKHL